jgi:hypothetical protein
MNEDDEQKKPEESAEEVTQPATAPDFFGHAARRERKEFVASVTATVTTAEDPEAPVLAADYLKALAPQVLLDAETQKAAAKALLHRSLWRKCDLSWKLEPHQLVAYRLIKAAAKSAPNNRFVLNASRRWGKTYTMCCLAVEYALRHPNSLTLYAGATQKAVRDMIVPIFNDIVSDAPTNLRGVLKVQTNQFVFANGSRIKLTGLDGGRLQKLRGVNAHFVVIDEAGFVDYLETAVTAVLFPMTSTTGGQMVLASNAPMTPGHDFVRIFTREAQACGSYHKSTILDVQKFTKEDIDRFAASSGGYDSSTFQREYLCVTGNTFITVRDREGLVRTLTIQELWNELPKNP